MVDSSSRTLVCIARLHSLKQPLPSLPPHSLHRTQLHAQSFGGLFVREAQEVLDLDYRAPLRMDLLELFQELIHGNGGGYLSAAGRKQILDRIDRDELRASAFPRNVDEIPAHGSRSYSEKMPPALPISIFCRYQAKIDLVDQFGGLQTVPTALALHQIVGQATQIRHHQGE